MPFPALGWGYVVRHSLTATLLVKSVTFSKCEKCNRVGIVQGEIYDGDVCDRGREFTRTDLSVSLDLRELPSSREGLALCEKWMF